MADKGLEEVPEGMFETPRRLLPDQSTAIWISERYPTIIRRRG